MPVDPLAAIGWKNGVLYFEDADIDRFTAEISRAYDIDIHHSGYLKWFHYRGPVPTTLTIDGLLQELSKPELKLDARLTGRTITIKPK
jgi:hypothetical protein